MHRPLDDSFLGMNRRQRHCTPSASPLQNCNESMGLREGRGNLKKGAYRARRIASQRKKRWCIWYEEKEPIQPHPKDQSFKTPCHSIPTQGPSIDGYVRKSRLGIGVTRLGKQIIRAVLTLEFVFTFATEFLPLQKYVSSGEKKIVFSLVKQQNEFPR